MVGLLEVALRRHTNDNFIMLGWSFSTNSSMILTSESLFGSSNPTVSIRDTIESLNMKLAKQVVCVQDSAAEDTGNSLALCGKPAMRLQRVDFPVPVFPTMSNFLKKLCLMSGVKAIF